MTFFLLFEAFLELLHEFVQATQRLDFLELFLGQVELFHLLQPFLGDGRIEQIAHHIFHPLEVGAEHPIELVELGFVLDQRGASQIVELVNRTECDPCLQGFQQGQIFGHAGLELSLAQGIEKIVQHASTPAAIRPSSPSKATTKLSVRARFQPR